MIKTTFITILIIISFYFNICSQNIEFTAKNFPDNKKELNEAIKNIKNGDKAFEERDYFKAIEYYKEAYTFNPNNSDINYKIGKAYLSTRHKASAISYINKSFELDSVTQIDIRYMMAQCLQLDYKFETAINDYLKYKLYAKRAGIATAELNKEIDKKIKECKSGIELCKNPVDVKIENLGDGLNTIYPEYNPIINADESVMIFTSRRENTTGGKKFKNDGEYYEDIYISYYKDSAWTSPVNPGPPLNTEDHDAAFGLSPDGQTLLSYIGTNGGDIYISKLDGDNWTTPVNIGDTINTEYHESSSTFLYDCKTLFFVSDNPIGGSGGRDIYMSKLDKKGRWGIPKNAGRTINTSLNEEGVFMHPDGKTLYFSSEGHNSMGGYDIFKTTYINGRWSPPINLGYPINTPDDDVFFSISADGKHAYYSSAKIGGFGEKDLYKITFLDKEKPKTIKQDSNIVAVVTNSLTILKGTVSDAKTNISLHSTIEITDNIKNTIIATFESNSKTGKYLISLPSGTNYGININSDGYLFHSENFDIPTSSEFKEIIKNISLNKLEVGNKVVLNNIFFDVSKSTLRPESTAELERLIKLMKDMPELAIEISGHTDNVGTAEYNQKLSESRASAVVSYLTSKGISASRLEFKGYGFEQPIATNDTEEGKQLNRRTEFKIIKR